MASRDRSLHLSPVVRVRTKILETFPIEPEHDCRSNVCTWTLRSPAVEDIAVVAAVAVEAEVAEVGGGPFVTGLCFGGETFLEGFLFI